MKIFISYAREDSDLALEIYDFLSRDEELQPWLDSKSLLPGDEWEYEIYNAIEESSLFLILLSKTSVNKTGFINKEIREALSKQDLHIPGDPFIIPIKLEPCDIKFKELKKYNYTNLYPDKVEALNKILQAIKKKMKRK